MQIQNVETWSVEGSGTKTIRLAKNGQGDRVVSSLYINPLDDATIVVTGFVSDDDTEGVELSCIDIAKLEKCDEVSEAGVYSYIVDAYYKVIIEATGTADIIIKTLY